MILRITLELKREVDSPDGVVKAGQMAMRMLEGAGWYVDPTAQIEVHGTIDRPE